MIADPRTGRRSGPAGAVARSIRLVSVFAGVLASLAPGQTPSAGRWEALRSFTLAEGANPASGAPLIQATNGQIYGVREFGGAENCGTLIRIAPDGSGFSVVRSFTRAEGDYPVAILQSRDGRLYGITNAGGSGPFGALFSLNLDGTGFSILYRFTSAATGWSPGTLLEGADGVLFGSCLGEADATRSPLSAIFRIERDGSGFRILRTLARATEGFGVHGGASVHLIQGGDGVLYGTAASGGSADAGTIFRLNPDGTGFRVLRMLSDAEGKQPNRLLLARGRLFGTAYRGGTAERGTLFSLEPDGSGFTVLRHLAGSFPPPTASQLPFAGLTEGRDGFLYGVSTAGGELREVGTLFRLDPATGAYLLLRTFQPGDGSPRGELLAADNGRLYGATAGGGLHAQGTLFAFVPAIPSVPTAAVGVPFVFSTVPILGAAGRYYADGLPPGLTIDLTTGDISGVPRNVGVFPVVLSARLPGEIGPVTINLEVGRAAVAIAITGLNQVYDGKAKPVTVSTAPEGLRYVVTYDGSPTPPVLPGSYAVQVRIQETDHVGQAVATLTITGAAPTIAPLPAVPAVVAGDAVSVAASVSGPGLLSYQWQRRSAGAGAFVDLIDGEGVSGSTGAVLAIRPATFAMNGDQFRLRVSNPLGSVLSDPVTLVVYPAAVLANVAVRARVRSGEPLTVGWVTSGARTLLVRAIGPGLGSFLGAAAVAGDPSLIVQHPDGARIASNADWGGAPDLVAASAAVGAFALAPDSADAALRVAVTGAATAQMEVTSAGLGLLELYDLQPAPGARIVNLSALYEAGTAEHALVLGLTVHGSGSKRLLVRGVGPGLRPFGVARPLLAARLDVYTAGALRLVGSEGWADALTAEFARVGAFGLPAGSRDAALVLTLPAGGYSIHLSSAGGESGTGLIEVYELP